MKKRFDFEFSEEYLKNAKKLIKSKRLSSNTLNDVLEKLSENPMDGSLIEIFVLDIGGHSGFKRVY